MEVLTEVPATGTKLRIDADRQFDGGPGDSTLRIQGQTQEGESVLDATYVECTADEATLVAWFLRAMRQPPPAELQEKMTQDIQAMFTARLSGKDSHQIAELAWAAITGHAHEKMGATPEKLEPLAERFERAAARSRSTAPGGTMTAHDGR